MSNPALAADLAEKMGQVHDENSVKDAYLEISINHMLGVEERKTIYTVLKDAMKSNRKSDMGDYTKAREQILSEGVPTLMKRSGVTAITSLSGPASIWMKIARRNAVNEYQEARNDGMPPSDAAAESIYETERIKLGSVKGQMTRTQIWESFVEMRLFEEATLPKEVESGVKDAVYNVLGKISESVIRDLAKADEEEVTHHYVPVHAGIRNEVGEPLYIMRCTQCPVAHTQS